MRSYPDLPELGTGARGSQVLAGEILRTEVGSGVHGMAIEGTDDLDLMAVFIEPRASVYGLAPALDHYTWRTQPEGARSGPGDVDYVAYSLRKFVRMAIKGHPTVLLPLFAPDEFVIRWTWAGQELRAMRQLFLSRAAVNCFLGYMHGQHERMMGGGKRNRLPNRPELIERYGWDCYLDDTEFLTRRGWLTYDAIGDEDVATIDTYGALEFQRPVERICKLYTGPIIFGRTRYSSWAVTPNHRMWVSKVERGACGKNGEGYAPDRAAWEFRRADAIQKASWHQRVTLGAARDEYPVSDAYLALVGAYVSEGYPAKWLQNGEVSVLAFDQKDGGRLHDVMDLIDTEFPLRRYRYPERRPATRFTLANREVARDVAKACGIGEHNKRLPEWTRQLSARQADVLLWAMLAGDGTPYKSGGWIYYTTSSGLAGDTQALALISGRRSNQWGPYAPASIYQILIVDPVPALQFEAFTASRHARVEDVVDRQIVCFTVPNERLVTRREGRVAMHGNTKYGAHALRLAYQGYEVAAHGQLTLPIPEPRVDRLRAVKQGQIPQDVVHAEILAVEADIQEMVRGGQINLPEHPDTDAIGEWMLSVHEAWWPVAESNVTPRLAV